MIFGIQPILLFIGAGVVVSLVLMFFACRARSGLVIALLLFLALAFAAPGIYIFLVLHPQLVDGRYRTYKAFYQDIKVGMTREEVTAVMEIRYPQGGRRRRRRLFWQRAEGIRQPDPGSALQRLRHRICPCERAVGEARRYHQTRPGHCQVGSIR